MGYPCFVNKINPYKPSVLFVVHMQIMQTQIVASDKGFDLLFAYRMFY